MRNVANDPRMGPVVQLLIYKLEPPHPNMRMSIPNHEALFLKPANGNYYSILGFYRDNGKENGNYYSFLLLHALSTQPQASVT